VHSKDLTQHRALPPCYCIHIPRLTVLEFLDRQHRGLHRVALLNHLGGDSAHEVEKVAKLRREAELHLLLLLDHLLHVAHLLLLLLDHLAQVVHRGRVLRVRVRHLLVQIRRVRRVRHLARRHLLVEVLHRRSVLALHLGHH
jgi:hypothetical protein